MTQINKKNILFLIILVALFLLIVFLSQTLLQKGNSSDWYSVKLADGSVYFGNITKTTPDEIVLSDAYSIETTEETSKIASSQNFQVQQTPQKVFALVHRGDNTQKTDHTMIINRASIMFWEKLAPDAQILQLIQKSKETK